MAGAEEWQARWRMVVAGEWQALERCWRISGFLAPSLLGVWQLRLHVCSYSGLSTKRMTASYTDLVTSYNL
jgi:hypothetical protein